MSASDEVSGGGGGGSGGLGEDMEIDPTPVAAPTRKRPSRAAARTSKRSRVVDANSDDDFDFEGEDSDGDIEESPAKRTRRAPAKKTPAKKTPAKKTPAKKTPAKKTPAKKTPAKKTPAKKTPAKKTVKKEPAKKTATKKTAAKKAPAKKTVKKEKVKKEPGRKAPAKVKTLKPEELLAQALKAHKWWEDEVSVGVHWKTMEHAGVCFPPAYKAHGVRMKYDGELVELTPEQEEVATFYASIPVDGLQLGEADIARQFNHNFWNDFQKLLGPDHVIQTFEKCDFQPIRDHLEVKKLKKKEMSKEEKEDAKAERKKLNMKHGYALVDGHLAKVGNTMIEPPSLFRGRGRHPNTGTLKKRVIPEEITINIGRGAPVPECPIPGHSWKAVVHDPTVTWLAYWKENVMDANKYVYLAASSSFKGRADMAKYEKARELKGCIGRIRRTYESNLSDKDAQQRQIATAMWIIDRLALRVGNEKDEDEADTYGCCSLLVSHLTFEGTAVTLKFLGKDSMPYENTVELVERYGDIGRRILTNLQSFHDGKAPTADLFDKLTPTILNKELSNLLPGLSAKVFRTFNASFTLEEQLIELKCDIEQTPKEKELIYNRANREVSILCNHQRTVPKSHEKSMEKLNEKKELLQSQIDDLKKMQTLVSKGKADKVVLKPKKIEDKEVAKTMTHMFTSPPSLEQVKTRLVKFQKRMESLNLSATNKEENKAVSLTTAKINYMDPRVTVAWCKRVECPIEAIFSATLRDKFPWAMSVDEHFKF